MTDERDATALLDAPWKAGAVFILYLVIQNSESYWLTPTVMVKQMALSFSIHIWLQHCMDIETSMIVEQPPLEALVLNLLFQWYVLEPHVSNSNKENAITSMVPSA